jgi:hypothetical protein
MDIVEFIEAPAFLGPHFVGDNWSTWKACLRAAYALPMTRLDRKTFAAVAGNRRPPRRAVDEFATVVGRGGGKDSAASAIAAFEAVRVDQKRLRPGERGTVLCLAVDRDQAAIVFRYIAAYFQRVPLLENMVERITSDTIELSNGAEIVVGTNSYRSVRGRTLVCVIFDEVAYWRDDTSANPDSEVDNAVTPGLARWPGSKKILISSPYRRAGLLYQKWSNSFGKDDENCLVVHGGTLQFNNTFPAGVIDRELKKDRERARAEYLAEWRDDLVSFIDRAAVEACVDLGCYERVPVKGITYHAFLDPSSGGGGDSMALAIAHREKAGAIVVDCVREARPPFDPAVRSAEFAATAKAYGCHKLTKDNWAVGFVDAIFKQQGIECEAATKNRSELYLELLPLVNARRVNLLDNERCVDQFCALERRVARSGKDSVNHPERGHDDTINAVAGAAFLAAGLPQGFVVTDETLASIRRPLVPGMHGPGARARYLPAYGPNGQMNNRLW